jgi:cell division septum initiation protein DivIVA
VKESEVLIGQAEVKAEKILDAAHRRAAKLTEDIREMKGVRTRLAAAVRTTIETHLALLEGLATDAQEDPLVDGKVAFLARSAPRGAGGAGGASGTGSAGA